MVQEKEESNCNNEVLKKERECQGVSVGRGRAGREAKTLLSLS